MLISIRKIVSIFLKRADVTPWNYQIDFRLLLQRKSYLRRFMHSVPTANAEKTV